MSAVACRAAHDLASVIPSIRGSLGCPPDIRAQHSAITSTGGKTVCRPVSTLLTTVSTVRPPGVGRSLVPGLPPVTRGRIKAPVKPRSGLLGLGY